MNTSEASEPCDYCAKAKTNLYFGQYMTSCVTCCARLIMTSPDQDRAFSAYFLIQGRLRSPSQERIANEVRRLKALKAIEGIA